MLSTIISFLSEGIFTSLDWFSDLLTESGTLPIVLFFLTLTIIYKYILSPIFGSSGSDIVRNQYRQGQANKRRQQYLVSRKKVVRKKVRKKP